MQKNMGNKGNHNDEENMRKSLEDYEHHIVSRKQASDFEVTTNRIINHIQENFESGRGLAESPRALTNLDKGSWGGGGE